MTGRTPACEDAGIAERMREIQNERMAAIAGCACPQRDTAGDIVHTPICPLRQPPPAALALAVALERLRARARLRSCTCAPSEAPRPCPHRYALPDCWSAANAQPELPIDRAIALADRAIALAEEYLDHIERAIEAKYARHRALTDFGRGDSPQRALFPRQLSGIHPAESSPNNRSQQ